MNRPCPDFKAIDQHGREHFLSDYKGTWLVIYFYPKDDTPGCTTEACEFRDSYDRLSAHNIRVLGVSHDSQKSHSKFAEKHSLPFPLLVDEDRTMIKAFGAWGQKSFMGRVFDGILRNTYVIDPQGMIVHEFVTVSPKGHAGEVYDFITSYMTSHA